MIRLILILLLTCSTAYPKPVDDNSKFNNYVEGAMEIYSQFKTPSKEESEEFYDFVKSKWIQSRCETNCEKWGYLVGKEYVDKKQVEVQPKKN